MATPEPKTYIALCDGFYGVKKDILYTYIEGDCLRDTKGVVHGDVNPAYEPEFFREMKVVTGVYAVGSSVVAKNLLRGHLVVPTYPFNALSSRKKITADFPAWMPLEVMGYTTHLKKVLLVVRHEKQTIRVPVDSVVPDTTYFFVNSSGEVNKQQLGRKPEADEWRKKTGNMFTNLEHARAFRKAVLDQDK